MRILLVEDDEALATMMEAALASNGHSSEVAHDGHSALTARGYDLVLLDLGLPDLDGREVCREIRRRGDDVPIMMVTASGDESDRVLGFELGADDYLVKPFSLPELMARIGVIEKRCGPHREQRSILDIGRHVQIDVRTRRVLLDETEVHLTPKEFDVLRFLCEDLGASYRRKDILEHVWGAEWFGSTKTLDTHVAAIRKKLAGGLVVVALRGVGFRVDGVG